MQRRLRRPLRPECAPARSSALRGHRSAPRPDPGGVPRGRDAARRAGDRRRGRALVPRAARSRRPARVAAVKPQSAFFEALGPARRAAVLARVIAEARARGLLVLLDAKRGDVGLDGRGLRRGVPGATARRFARDAITLNPYLGLDSLEPFLRRGREQRRRALRGAALEQPGRARLPGSAGAASVRSTSASPRRSARRRSALRGPETEWSSLGVVVGATRPEESRRVREILPRSLFLVPGYGAQGGSARDAVAGFVAGPGRAPRRRPGGLVARDRLPGRRPQRRRRELGARRRPRPRRRHRRAHRRGAIQRRLRCSARLRVAARASEAVAPSGRSSARPCSCAGGRARASS